MVPSHISAHCDVVSRYCHDLACSTKWKPRRGGGVTLPELYTFLFSSSAGAFFRDNSLFNLRKNLTPYVRPDLELEELCLMIVHPNYRVPSSTTLAFGLCFLHTDPTMWPSLCSRDSFPYGPVPSKAAKILSHHPRLPVGSRLGSRCKMCWPDSSVRVTSEDLISPPVSADPISTSSRSPTSRHPVRNRLTTHHPWSSTECTAEDLVPVGTLPVLVGQVRRITRSSRTGNDTCYVRGAEGDTRERGNGKCVDNPAFCETNDTAGYIVALCGASRGRQSS